MRDCTEWRTYRDTGYAKPLLDIDDYTENFEIGFPPFRHANTTTLASVFDHRRYVGKKIVYLYDFGANWEHIITVGGKIPNTGVKISLAKGHRPAKYPPHTQRLFTNEDKERINHHLAAFPELEDYRPPGYVEEEYIPDENDPRTEMMRSMGILPPRHQETSQRDREISGSSPRRVLGRRGRDEQDDSPDERDATRVRRSMSIPSLLS